jgi:hypothetical protein
MSSNSKVLLMSEDGKPVPISQPSLGLIGIFKGNPINPAIHAAITNNTPVPVPSVKAEILAKLVEWVEIHAEMKAKAQRKREIEERDELLEQQKANEAGPDDKDAATLEPEFGEEEEEFEEDQVIANDEEASESEEPGTRFLRAHLEFEDAYEDDYLMADLEHRLGPLSPFDKKFFEELELGTLIELTKVNHHHNSNQYHYAF